MQSESAELHTCVRKYGAALQHQKVLGKTAKQSVYSLTIRHTCSYLTTIKFQKY